MGFGRACAPVRCAPPPRPSQLRCFLFDPKNQIKSIELGTPTSWAFFFPLDHRGYVLFVFSFFLIDFWSFLFVILFLFFSPFLISSHSSILILVFLSVLILLILLVLFFVFLFFFLYFNLFVVLHTHTNYVPVRPYVLTFVFLTFIFFILFLFFSLQKTPRKFQFGKTNPPKYTTAYIVQ